jgi:hypothetical protein
MVLAVPAEAMRQRDHPSAKHRQKVFSLPLPSNAGCDTAVFNVIAGLWLTTALSCRADEAAIHERVTFQTLVIS